jgi:Fe2+ or Zn2+ uptake regulation protein
VKEPARRLREHDLKATAQRVAVLRALEAGGHPSAPEVHERVDEETPTVTANDVEEVAD